MSLNLAIHTQLISKIKSTLSSVDSIKEVVAYPSGGNFDNYPAVVFFPDSFENDFSTTKTNEKIYRFKMWIVVNAEKFTTEEVFEEILPKNVDEVLEKFDNDWDYGTINGHRARALINSGFWGMGEEENGKVAWAELDLLIKVQTDN